MSLCREDATLLKINKQKTKQAKQCRVLLEQWQSQWYPGTPRGLWPIAKVCRNFKTLISKTSVRVYQTCHASSWFIIQVTSGQEGYLNQLSSLSYSRNKLVKQRKYADNHTKLEFFWKHQNASLNQTEWFTGKLTWLKWNLFLHYY